MSVKDMDFFFTLKINKDFSKGYLFELIESKSKKDSQGMYGSDFTFADGSSEYVSNTSLMQPVPLDAEKLLKRKFFFKTISEAEAFMYKSIQILIEFTLSYIEKLEEKISQLNKKTPTFFSKEGFSVEKCIKCAHRFEETFRNQSNFSGFKHSEMIVFNQNFIGEVFLNTASVLTKELVGEELESVKNIPYYGLSDLREDEKVLKVVFFADSLIEEDNFDEELYRTKDTSLCLSSDSPHVEDNYISNYSFFDYQEETYNADFIKNLETFRRTSLNFLSNEMSKKKEFLGKLQSLDSIFSTLNQVYFE